MTTRPCDALCDTTVCGAARQQGWHRLAPPAAAAAGPPQALTAGKGLLSGQSAHLCPTQSQPRGTQAHSWGHCWPRLGWHSPAAAPASFPALRTQTLQDALEEARIAQVVEARSDTACLLTGHANLLGRKADLLWWSRSLTDACKEIRC